MPEGVKEIIGIEDLKPQQVWQFLTLVKEGDKATEFEKKHNCEDYLKFVFENVDLRKEFKVWVKEIPRVLLIPTIDFVSSLSLPEQEPELKKSLFYKIITNFKPVSLDEKTMYDMVDSIDSDRRREFLSSILKPRIASCRLSIKCLEDMIKLTPDREKSAVAKMLLPCLEVDSIDPKTMLNMVKSVEELFRMDLFKILAPKLVDSSLLTKDFIDIMEHVPQPYTPEAIKVLVPKLDKTPLSLESLERVLNFVLEEEEEKSYAITLLAGKLDQSSIDYVMSATNLHLNSKEEIILKYVATSTEYAASEKQIKKFFSKNNLSLEKLKSAKEKNPNFDNSQPDTVVSNFEASLARRLSGRFSQH